MHSNYLLKEWKIFDPRDPLTAAYGSDLVDASVTKRTEGWWMVLAGQPGGDGATDLYSANLGNSTALSPVGWRPLLDGAGQLVPLSARNRSALWDGKGGRHCPSYVKGWDPNREAWAERIYYAGAAENLWGPYTIGFLEWDGVQWQDQPEPVFRANEDWEHGSVYEPNLVYHDGKWKMWYVAGSNREDYLLKGYAESEDGKSGWSTRALFAPTEMRMFDFCVSQRGDAFDAIFARVWVKEDTPPPQTGLWWCRAKTPSSRLSDWGQPGGTPVHGSLHFNFMSKLENAHLSSLTARIEQTTRDHSRSHSLSAALSWTCPSVQSSVLRTAALSQFQVVGVEVVPG